MACQAFFYWYFRFLLGFCDKSARADLLVHSLRVVLERNVETTETRRDEALSVGRQPDKRFSMDSQQNTRN